MLDSLNEWQLQEKSLRCALTENIYNFSLISTQILNCFQLSRAFYFSKNFLFLCKDQFYKLNFKYTVSYEKVRIAEIKTKRKIEDY